jgi:hypothetical protein
MLLFLNPSKFGCLDLDNEYEKNYYRQKFRLQKNFFYEMYLTSKKK